MIAMAWWAWMALMLGGQGEADYAKLRPVEFTAVQIEDGFWSPRLEVNRTVILPHNLKYCAETGRIRNFDRAAGKAEGDYEGRFYNDSDVYKVLEGAAYSLQLHRDPALEAQVDAIIETIAGAQQPDGYLNAYYTVMEPENRWTNLAVMHELYCAGHMFEAAVAYHQATGKSRFLEVAKRKADHIDTIFGPGKRVGYSGHEEIELALVKLYRETGEERYFKLTQWFLEVRGQNRDPKEEYMQAHLPIAEQDKIVGHAVRAMYLYSGVADVVAITGRRDWLEAMERLWGNVTLQKMYLTGGIGASHGNEGFSEDYDLPNDAAYCETCASIGMALWNHRMLMLRGEGRFADVLERVLYNAIPAGVSLGGDKFFYVNPLASKGKHHREPWFGTACCPTNMVRFLPSLGGYVYATSDDGLWVNLYVGNRAKVELAGQPVAVELQARYPWQGEVTLKLSPAKAATFGVYLHKPAWCHSFAVKVNGQPVDDASEQDGYVQVRRSWSPGDVLSVSMAMDVVRVQAHPKVSANVGRVALQRGPVVYCLEQVDHDGPVRNVVLPAESDVRAEPAEALLGGVMVLKSQGQRVVTPNWVDRLYQPAAAVEPVALTAVPYCVWDNRAPGQMVVWLPESRSVVTELPLPPSRAKGAKVTASHCFDRDTVTAVNDELLGEGSHDKGVPLFSWYPHRGTAEWIEYAFDEPITVSVADVYWWDDELEKGNSRVPANWQLLYLKDGQWEPVRASTPLGRGKDQFNRVVFEPVTTRGLRIEAQLQDGWSGGILEWHLP